MGWRRRPRGCGAPAGGSIWLNPLLRYAEFEPRAAGIKAMLPCVDEFRPVHSLETARAAGGGAGGDAGGAGAIPDHVGRFRARSGADAEAPLQALRSAAPAAFRTAIAARPRRRRIEAGWLEPPRGAARDLSAQPAWKARMRPPAAPARSRPPRPAWRPRSSRAAGRAGARPPRSCRDRTARSGRPRRPGRGPPPRSPTGRAPRIVALHRHPGLAGAGRLASLAAHPHPARPSGRPRRGGRAPCT